MDKHLNLFYSYNQDEELIENNLTRALIVTLMGISDNTRNIILSSLNDPLSQYNYNAVEFTLQGNVATRIKDYKNKYIITLASDKIIQSTEDYLAIDKDVIKETLCNQIPPSNSPSILKSLCGGAIPDAWIHDSKDHEYCFLIECKTQEDYLYFPQIIRHAYNYYGLTDLEEINKITIRLTWDDMLESIDLVSNFENEQEQFIIDNFINFLGFFGFSLFRGFDFQAMPARPSIDISTKESFQLFFFDKLKQPIDITLRDKEDRLLFDFNSLPMMRESLL